MQLEKLEYATEKLGLLTTTCKTRWTSKKLSPSDKQAIQSFIEKRASSSTLASDLRTCTAVSVHPSTVRRQLSAKDGPVSTFWANTDC